MPRWCVIAGFILPQLGAPGVAAHEIRKGCGFSVAYGPVRALDIRPFLEGGGKASPAMRRVDFPVMDRLALTPVEITGLLRPAGWAAAGLFLLAGIGPGIFSPGAAWERGFSAVAALAGGILAGAVVTPALLPWLPGRAFSVKGGIAGGVLAACAAMWGRGALDAPATLALLLAMTAVSSFVAMNFTGATPYHLADRRGEGDAPGLARPGRSHGDGRPPLGRGYVSPLISAERGS